MMMEKVANHEMLHQFMLHNLEVSLPDNCTAGPLSALFITILLLLLLKH